MINFIQCKTEANNYILINLNNVNIIKKDLFDFAVFVFDNGKTINVQNKYTEILKQVSTMQSN